MGEPPISFVIPLGNGLSSLVVQRGEGFRSPRFIHNRRVKYADVCKIVGKGAFFVLLDLPTRSSTHDGGDIVNARKHFNKRKGIEPADIETKKDP